MTAVAKRYARAAVEAASEHGGDKAVDALASVLDAFKAAYESCSELKEVLANPALSAHRESVLGAVLDKLGAGPSVARLIKILADNDRINLVPEVTAEVERLVDESAGRLRATVISAIELTQDQSDRIAGALRRRLGRPVLVTVQVDREILGGLICQVGDLKFDSSLKRQLEVLRERLL